MASAKQILANRKNAQRSTGPRSNEGKALVARNAVKHGILSEHVPLNEAEYALFKEFYEGMKMELSPKDSMQHLLADRIISTAWRLRRIVHVEALMLQKAEKSTWSNSYRDAFEGRSADYMGIISRYERTLENALFRAMREYKCLKEQESLEICSLPLG